MIKFIDLSREGDFLIEKLSQKFNRLVREGTYILGKELREFEREFASYTGARFGLGVNSGTDALFLALLSLGIGRGDEVIVPAFTYLATALAVSYTAARPVFCDIEDKTYGIDPEDLERKITPRTKAVIVVHLYGHPANMKKILKIAQRYKLKVIEDCAQAHGAEIRLSERARKKVGSLGDLGCFSFYPTKNLGCYGDGGMIVTNSEKLYGKLLLLRDYGRDSRYRHKIIGYNSRLDTIQASILRVKFKYLESWNQRRRKLAALYNRLLGRVEEIRLPEEEKGYQHVYHLYVIRIKKKRDYLHQSLARKKIQTLIHYPLPCHLQPAYRNLQYRKGSFPTSEKLAQEVLSLPLYPFLREEEVKQIAQAVMKSLS